MPNRRVGLEVRVVQRIDVRAKALADPRGQRALVADGRDGGELVVERREALRLDRLLVHVAGVVIANLALVRSRRGGAGCGRLEHRVRALLRQVEEHRPGAGAAAIGRDLGLLQPRAVGVPEEIVAGRDRRIHAGPVNVVSRSLGGGGGCRGARPGAAVPPPPHARGTSASPMKAPSRAEDVCHDCLILSTRFARKRVLDVECAPSRARRITQKEVRHASKHFVYRVFIALAILGLAIGNAAAQVSDSWLGTWKLNLAKSICNPPLSPRNGSRPADEIR